MSANETTEKFKSPPKPASESTLAGSPGSVTPDDLIFAFVQGAQWWEFQKTQATMCTSDSRMAEVEAACRIYNGTLGQSANATLSEGAGK